MGPISQFLAPKKMEILRHIPPCVIQQICHGDAIGAVNRQLTQLTVDKSEFICNKDSCA